MKIAIYIEDKPNGEIEVCPVKLISGHGNAERAADVAIAAIRREFGTPKNSTMSRESIPEEDKNTRMLDMLQKFHARNRGDKK